MKIQTLKVANVKGVKQLELNPDPDAALVIIAGNNGQGKSSTLDSIWYALGGAKAVPGQPIRHGQEKGGVELTTSTGLVVRRVFQDGKPSKLVVETKDGLRPPKPETFLKALAGEKAFDPLEFANEEAKKQYETIRELVGIDFDGLNMQRRSFFDKRAEHNREVKRLKAVVESIEIPEGTPKDLVDVGDLARRITEATELRNEVMRVESERDALLEERDRLHARLKEIEDQVAPRTKRIAELENTHDHYSKVPEWREELSHAETTNANVRKWKERDQAIGAMEREEEAAAELTNRINDIDQDKAAQIQSATFPVEGMALDDETGKVLFNGIPLDQCAQSERIRISLAVAFALNSQLKIALIREGSLLDNNGLELVRQITEEHGGQTWLERVGTDGPTTYVIEEGVLANA